MLIPEIKINQELCRSPLECAVCLSVCPQAVFKAKPANVYKFRETPEEEYTLKAVYRVDCSGCGRCVRECPAGAISIDFKPLGPGKEGRADG
ncbi:MAG: 4Fe-4S dicluster domain-containing protein [Peptococcaceae bacterium]|nr:4Fe-4S dicluster domain-containing protein [Peptococcaceae bacterium]